MVRAFFLHLWAPVNGTPANNSLAASDGGLLQASDGGQLAAST